MPDNTCVCCGAVIPEGRQICPSCEGEEKRRKSLLAGALCFPTFLQGVSGYNDDLSEVGGDDDSAR